MPDSKSPKAPEGNIGFTLNKSDNGIVCVKLLSSPDVAMIKSIIEQITALGQSPLRLMDCRGIKLNLDMTQQDQIADVIRSNPMYGRRTAFLVDNPLSFARIRQFMAYREEEVIERQVFREEADALHWLLSGDAPATDETTVP